MESHQRRMSGCCGSVARWFDTAAFVNPAQFTFGNSARNVLRAPGRVNFDLMLAKQIPITERIRLDFRTEAFNLTNTPPLGFPGATIGTPAPSCTAAPAGLTAR